MSLEETKQKIRSAQELLSLASTMKALAAVSVRQYQNAVLSLGRFDTTLQAGLGVLLRHVPPSTGTGCKTGIVVVGSDQGMCGPFNENLIRFVAEAEKEAPGHLVSLGYRLDGALPWEADRALRLPTGVAGITSVVQEVVLELEQARCEKDLAGIALFFNKPSEKSTTYHPEKRDLLPLSPSLLRRLQHQPWESNRLPDYQGSRRRVFSHLLRLWLFVGIYGALANSLAAENTARLVAMQSAQKNIEERLESLRAGYHRQRQTMITSELLDVVTGFETIMGE